MKHDDVTELCLASSTRPRRRNLLAAVAQYIVSHFRSSSTKSSSWFLSSLLMRVVVKEDNKVHSFLLTNLAMSDLLMGVYLLIIAMKDVQWQGVYFAHDYKWRSGVPCALTGVLSMVSSEVSVLMLTVITTDRLICVVFPFKVRRMLPLQLLEEFGSLE